MSSTIFEFDIYNFQVLPESYRFSLLPHVKLFCFSDLFAYKDPNFPTYHE